MSELFEVQVNGSFRSIERGNKKELQKEWEKKMKEINPSNIVLVKQTKNTKLNEMVAGKENSKYGQCDLCGVVRLKENMKRRTYFVSESRIEESLCKPCVRKLQEEACKK